VGPRAKNSSGGRALGGRWRRGHWRRRRPLWCFSPLQRLLARRRRRAFAPQGAQLLGRIAAVRFTGTAARRRGAQRATTGAFGEALAKAFGGTFGAAAKGLGKLRRRLLAAAKGGTFRRPATLGPFGDGKVLSGEGKLRPTHPHHGPFGEDRGLPATPATPAATPKGSAPVPALALLALRSETFLLRQSPEAAFGFHPEGGGGETAPKLFPAAPLPTVAAAPPTVAAALTRRVAAGNRSGSRRWGPPATAGASLLRNREHRQRPLAAPLRRRALSGRRSFRSRFGEVRALNPTSSYTPEVEELPLPELQRRVPGQRWLLPPTTPFEAEEPRWRSAEVAFDRERWHSGSVADYRQREYHYRLQCSYRQPGFRRRSRRAQRSPLRWGLRALPRQRLSYALAQRLLGAAAALAPLLAPLRGALAAAENFSAENLSATQTLGAKSFSATFENLSASGSFSRPATAAPATPAGAAAPLRKLLLLAGRRPAAAALEETGFLPSHRYGTLGSPERWWQERPTDPYAWLLEEGGPRLHRPLQWGHWGELRVEPQPSAAAAYRSFGAQRRLRRSLEGLSLCLILSPRRNNLYLVIQPRRFSKRPGERLFGRSAGELSKFKGFRRRSSANRRDLYKLAAFRLLRHHKKDRRHRFLLVVLKGLLDTLPRRLSTVAATEKHLRSILNPFLRRQLATRYPIIGVQTDQGYAQQKRGYPHRSRKHKGTPKKRSL